MSVAKKLSFATWRYDSKPEIFVEWNVFFNLIVDTQDQKKYILTILKCIAQWH